VKSNSSLIALIISWTSRKLNLDSDPTSPKSFGSEGARSTTLARTLVVSLLTRLVTEMQQHNTKMEFQKRKDEVILGLNEQGLNAALFWEVRLSSLHNFLSTCCLVYLLSCLPAALSTCFLVYLLSCVLLLSLSAFSNCVLSFISSSPH
jgi:hypothetical protein